METRLSLAEVSCLRVRFGGPRGLVSYSEVAAALGMTEFTARRLEQIALRKLRRDAVPLPLFDQGETRRKRNTR